MSLCFKVQKPEMVFVTVKDDAFGTSWDDWSFKSVVDAKAGSSMIFVKCGEGGG